MLSNRAPDCQGPPEGRVGANDLAGLVYALEVNVRRMTTTIKLFISL
ncbi:MAG: hypothetical protein M3247_01485 [Thermoproteota archaeon]|nr:hypothetical protein [Thermoproteota archaeon]